MGWDSPSHWLILAILVVALFGYKKLPDASRAVGRSLRIFKTELKGITQDDQAREHAAQEIASVQQHAVDVSKPAQQTQAPAGGEPPATQG